MARHVPALFGAAILALSGCASLEAYRSDVDYIAEREGITVQEAASRRLEALLALANEEDLLGAIYRYNGTDFFVSSSIIERPFGGSPELIIVARRMPDGRWVLYPDDRAKGARDFLISNGTRIRNASSAGLRLVALRNIAPISGPRPPLASQPPPRQDYVSRPNVYTEAIMERDGGGGDGH